MVNGISSNAASYTGSNTQTEPVQAAPGTTAAQSTAKTTASNEDSVKLSATAQARLMLHQGMTLSQIAANLGLSLQAVTTTLGLTTSSSVATAAAPPASSAK
jgi:hypothetical protein